MKSIFNILLVLSVYLPAFAEKPSEDLVSWVVANRTTFDSLSSDDAKIKIKEFLKTKLEGKKFVHIGEPEHYMHEKWPYRELIMSALFELDYTTILNEMGRMDGKMVNSYLQTGDESFLKKVCLWAWCSGNKDKSSVYGAEDARHFKNLYQLAQKAGVKIRYFGWDLDQLPQENYEPILKTLQGCSCASPILAKLQRKTGESMTEEGDRIYEALIDYNRQKTQLKKCFTEEQYQDLYWDIRTLSDSFKLIGQLTGALEKLAVNPLDDVGRRESLQFFILREPTGYDRTRYILENSPKDEKFIIVGHNMHALKYSAYSSYSHKNDTGIVPAIRSIGEMIETNHPGETFNIWLGVGQGEHGTKGNPCDGKDKGQCPQPPVPGTFEEAFVKVSNSPWIVELAGAPLPKMATMSIFMTNENIVNLKQGADAYFFIPRTTFMVR